MLSSTPNSLDDLFAPLPVVPGKTAIPKGIVETRTAFFERLHRGESRTASRSNSTSSSQFSSVSETEDPLQPVDCFREAYQTQIDTAITQRREWSQDGRLANALLSIFIAEDKLNSELIDTFVTKLDALIPAALQEANDRADANECFLQFYHRGEHAAELGDDVTQCAERDFHLQNRSVKKLLISLARFAAICHDIEQRYTGKIVMKNEAESAEYFKTRVTQLAADIFHEKDRDNFEKAIQYLVKELIVNATTFVPCNGFQQFASLSALILQQEQGQQQRYSNAVMRILQLQALIAALDTSRTAMPSVLHKKVLVKRLTPAYAGVRVKAMMDRLFSSSYLNISNFLDKQESFLLLFCQDLRMIVELNLFHKIMTSEDVDKYKQLFKGDNPSLRGKLLSFCLNTDEIKKNCKDLMDTFFERIFEKDKTQCAAEISFARAVSTQHYIATMQAYCMPGQPNMLSCMDPDLWATHAKDLGTLKTFYASLSDQNKKLFATTIFHLTANQPGCELVAQYQEQATPVQQSRIAP